MSTFEDTGEGAIEDYDSKDDLKLVDEDTVIFSKEERFSHIQLTMSAYQKSIDAGCQEMMKGYWEDKIDKFGNQMKIYHSDTRLVLIECIKTLGIVMAGDMDKPCRDNIKKYLDAVDKFKTKMIDEEEAWYKKQNYQTRNSIVHIAGNLNQDSIYYHTLINFQVDMYREIFEELELMLKRSNYLKKRMLTN